MLRNIQCQASRVSKILLRWPVVLGMVCASMVGAETPTSMQLEKDIPYAQVGDLTLTLDLYRPASRQISPLIVWVHGGAWRAGNKSSMPLQGLVAEGHAIASVDYRLTTQAKFPANVHDIKAAIRFLRAKGPSLGLDAEQIVICLLYTSPSPRDS